MKWEDLWMKRQVSELKRILNSIRHNRFLKIRFNNVNEFNYYDRLNFNDRMSFRYPNLVIEYQWKRNLTNSSFGSRCTFITILFVLVKLWNHLIGKYHINIEHDTIRCWENYDYVNICLNIDKPNRHCIEEMWPKV